VWGTSVRRHQRTGGSSPRSAASGEGSPPARGCFRHVCVLLGAVVRKEGGNPVMPLPSGTHEAQAGSPGRPAAAPILCSGGGTHQGHKRCPSTWELPIDLEGAAEECSGGPHGVLASALLALVSLSKVLTSRATAPLFDLLSSVYL
jgi:hypothetical protein